jgi:hypothetical protein
MSSLVPGQLGGPLARPAPTRPPIRPGPFDCPPSSSACGWVTSWRWPGVATITRGQPAPSVRRVQLGAHPPRLAPNASSCGWTIPFPGLPGMAGGGPGGVLVRAYDRAVHVVAQPVQLPAGISAAVDLSQKPLEICLVGASDRSGWLPSSRSRTGWADPARGRRCGPAHHRLYHLAVVVVGPAGRRALGRHRGSRIAHWASVSSGSVRAM